MVRVPMSSDTTCGASDELVSLAGDDPTVIIPAAEFTALCASTNVDARSQITFAAGRSLGRFLLLEPLGGGAFGAVWKAFDPLLDRIVAVKVSSAAIADNADGFSLLREARSASQLRHPNIVRIHEVGVQGETTFIVCDLVDGVTLAEWMHSHRADFRESATLCAKIARALDHAHQQGVVHRDLKPGNIMLSLDGEPYVLDFGLSKRGTGEATSGEYECIVGTPAYMPPEQAQGAAFAVDGRADVYSLGVILFELLTGRRPFMGTTSQLLRQLLTDLPPSPRAINGAIPRDLEQICLRCLAKSPGSRYASAGELADDLESFRAGRPVRARRIGLVRRSLRMMSRHPVVSGTSVATLIALTLAMVSNLHSGETSARLVVSQVRSDLLRDRLWVERVLSLARSPQYSLAVAEADRMRSTERIAPARYYDLACVYSLACTPALQDLSISEQRRNELVKQYCTSAIELLHQARDAGYFRSPDSCAHLRDDRQLAFLRGETDFDRFVQHCREDWR